MVWIPIGAWIAALLVAAVVLGYCAYEIVWKTKRLRGDLAGLQGSAAQLTALQGALAGTQQRLAAVRAD